MLQIHTDDTIREDLRQMCRPLPVYMQRKVPTRAGLLTLLEQLVSAHYNAEESRDELPINEHYNAAFNAQWLTVDDPRWSGGTKYRRHRITALGRAVLGVLREDERVPDDEYSAEWRRAEALADALLAERERIKAALLERARRTAVLREMQDATADADRAAERSMQRYG